MDGETHHHVRPRRRALLSAVTPPSSSTVEDTKYKEDDYSDDQLLTVPAGWMIKLVAIQVELITSCFLSLIAPFLYLYFQSQAVPSRFAHGVTALLRRLTFGILGAVCAMVILLAVMVVSVLLGVGLARLCVEEPVLLRQPLHFDYTQVHPNATVALRGAWRRGRAVPAGHSVSVSIMLLLPESDHNLRIGVFQVNPTRQPCESLWIFPPNIGEFFFSGACRGHLIHWERNSDVQPAMHAAVSKPSCATDANVRDGLPSSAGYQ